MGAVDLVIQVESPKSVARGLQRIGRSGHGVGGTSKGRIFPKFRADLLECAVVVRRCARARSSRRSCRATRSTCSPSRSSRSPPARRRSPSTSCTRSSRAPTPTRAAPRAARERARHARRPLPLERVRRAAAADHLGPPRRHDPRPQGRAQARRRQRRHDPRPRPVRGDAPGRPPRRRARRGDGLRGAPRADLPARRDGLADRGDRPRPRDRHAGAGRAGRRAVLARRLGRAPEGARRGDRRVLALGGRPAAEVLERDYDLDALAARNLLEFLREQQAATGVVPPTARSSSSASATRSATGGCACSRRSAAACTPPGGSALSARIRERYGLESDAIWSDDGIVVHLPDADAPPQAELVLPEPDELEELVVGELASSALFGARFRENAARALLIPRAYPGRRTPLWQQRLKAQTLLEVARRYPDFPIVLETYRECLRDVLDVAGLHAAARDRAPRDLARRGRDAERLAVRLLAAVRLRRDLHVRGRRAQRRAARGRAVARPRAAARAARPGGAARADRRRRARRARGRPAAPLAGAPRDLARRAPRRAARARRPDRRAGARARARRARRRRDARRAGRASAAPSRSASRASRAGSRPRTPASTATRSAWCRPPGCRRRSSRTSPTRCASWSRGTRAPRPVHDRRAPRRYGVDVERPLRELEAAGPSCAASCAHLHPRARSGEREWCDPEVLRRLRRASLAVLRREIEPAERRALARLPAVLAGRRPPCRRRRRDRAAARGARAAAGARAAGGAVGARGAAAPHRRLLDELARPALRRRRDRLGRRGRDRPPLRPRRALLPRRRPGDRAACRRGQARRSGRARARADPRAPARPRPASSATCGRDRRAGRGAPGGALGPRLGRRGHQRRLGAAARAPARAARGGAGAATRFANPRSGRRFAPAVRASRAQTRAPVQGRWSLVAPLFRPPPTPSRGGARWPSCCSSATAS